MNFQFLQKIPSQFWRRPFFFGDHLFLGGKTVSISDKPFESDSKAMKIRVKVAYSCLTLSKKPPPLFEILATRLLMEIIVLSCFHTNIVIIETFGRESVPR